MFALRDSRSVRPAGRPAKRPIGNSWAETATIVPCDTDFLLVRRRRRRLRWRAALAPVGAGGSSWLATQPAALPGGGGQALRPDHQGGGETRRPAWFITPGR